MKLELSDFSYLGIDIQKYSDEERKNFKNGIEVDDLIEYVDGWLGYVCKIHGDIHIALHSICWEIYKNRNEEFKSRYVYKTVLEGMIELREKGINVLHKELNPFKDGEFIEAEFIERYYLYPEILEVLKDRNIKRLKQLFEERENLTTKPLKAHMERETEKMQELQQFLTRFVELISNAPDEIYEDYSTLTFYNRLNSLAKEYKKYETDNCEKE
jgi:hypothetical protein